MKKIATVIFVILLISSVFVLFACNKSVVDDGDYIVITVETTKVKEGATLKDYMDYLSSKEIISYEMENGMVISINGKSGNSNQYWMLYTDDTGNSNDAWGTVEYEEKTYASASLGAEQLIVKDGAKYIWKLQTF